MLSAPPALLMPLTADLSLLSVLLFATSSSAADSWVEFGHSVRLCAMLACSLCRNIAYARKFGQNAQN